MYLRYPQCWRIIFVPFFTNIDCICYLWDVRLSVSSWLALLFTCWNSSPSSTSRIVPSILGSGQPMLVSVSYNTLTVLYPRPRGMEDCYFAYHVYLCFYCLFWVIFCLIDTSLLRRRAVSPSAIFDISYKLELPGISVTCFFAPFFIKLRSPTVTAVNLFIRSLRVLHSLKTKLAYFQIFFFKKLYDFNR